jgi:hypothetical protein
VKPNFGAIGYIRSLGVLAGCFLLLTLARADCPCGPLYCLNTPGYSAALAAKKKALSNNGYPARMVAILDRVGHCEGCISTSPDAFSLMTESSDGSITIDGWDADNERIGAQQKAAGSLKACFVIYVRHACSCCQETPFGHRGDYNSELDLNTDMAIPCNG